MLEKMFSILSRTKFWVWLIKVVFSNLNLRLWGGNKGAIGKLEEIKQAIRSVADDEVVCFVAHNRASLGGKLIRWVTGEYWTHCGFVITPSSVAHMLPATGLTYHNMAQVVATYDDFAIITFNLIDGKELELKTRFDQVYKAQYDFQKRFDTGDYNLYCSEFIYYLLNGIIKQDLKPRLVHGQLGFTPQDVYMVCNRVLFKHLVGAKE